MKNEEFKQQQKEFKIVLKQNIKNWEGVFSEIDKSVIPTGYDLITDKQKEDIFNEQKNQYLEKEKKKAQTILKNNMKEISRLTFKAQLEYLKSNIIAKHKLIGFNRDEAINIYESILTN